MYFLRIGKKQQLPSDIRLFCFMAKFTLRTFIWHTTKAPNIPKTKKYPAAAQKSRTQRLIREHAGLDTRAPKDRPSSVKESDCTSSSRNSKPNTYS